MNKKFKSGNTTLIFNDTLAVKSQKEIDEILNNIAKNAIINTKNEHLQ